MNIYFIFTKNYIKFCLGLRYSMFLLCFFNKNIGKCQVMELFFYSQISQIFSAFKSANVFLLETTCFNFTLLSVNECQSVSKPGMIICIQPYTSQQFLTFLKIIIHISDLYSEILCPQEDFIIPDLNIDEAMIGNITGLNLHINK